MQEQILNSAPVKAIMASIVQTAAVYDMKSIVDALAQSSSHNNDSKLETELWPAQELACVQALKSDLVDETMILEDHAYLPLGAINTGIIYNSAPAFAEFEAANPLMNWL